MGISNSKGNRLLHADWGQNYIHPGIKKVQVPCETDKNPVPRHDLVSLQSKEDKKTDKEEMECSICSEYEKCVLFQPCNHLCCCNSCTQKLLTKDTGILCPICGRTPTSLTNIFLS